MSETVAICESVSDFKRRKGQVLMNRGSRASTFSWSKRDKRGFYADNLFGPPTDVQKNWGHVDTVGGRKVRKDATAKQLQDAIDAAKPGAMIVELYPTVFCECEAPSWQFIEFYERGHRTCRKCGICHHMKQENFNLHLNEDGHQNKSQWNFTPGMQANDTALYKRGRRLQLQGQKTRSHLRNMWRIKSKIDDFTNRWNFDAIEGIIRTAKAKLLCYYKTIHCWEAEADSGYYDVREKLPHGGAALAATCFYIAILEFEERTNQKTICTLPAIAEFAQTLRDKKVGRQTRDVTENVILRYAKRIKRRGYCSARIPEIGAKTLQFKPQSAALEHARMAIFNQCSPVRFALPNEKSWGIDIEDTKQGVLAIKSVNTAKSGFKAGLRKGDYLFELNRQVLGVSTKPSQLEKMVSKVRQQKGKRVVEITIMRKKKN
jgi:hypothetical protein